MKIGKMKCPELPHPRIGEGKLEVFGRPCPDVPQHEPHTINDIQAHKQMAGGNPSRHAPGVK
jgi:hypothetical protein